MTLPNEAGAWDADFSYDYLERLYERIRRDYEICRVGDFSVVAPPRPRAVIRHDVDVSIDDALRLAQREAGWGVRSTYHVMIDSPFYDVRSDRSVAAMCAIADMGHEIGLHYDVAARKSEDDSALRATDIAGACDFLAGLVGRRIRSLSFHRPIPEVMGGPSRIAGRVNAYAAELFRWYLSDSRGRWREGNPLDSLGRPRGDTLQVLIHPIWWSETPQRPAERLRAFLLELMRAGDSRSFDELRTALWDHVLYRAADLSAGPAPH